MIRIKVPGCEVPGTMYHVGFPTRYFVHRYYVLLYEVPGTTGTVVLVLHVQYILYIPGSTVRPVIRNTLCQTVRYDLYEYEIMYYNYNSFI